MTTQAPATPKLSSPSKVAVYWIFALHGIFLLNDFIYPYYSDTFLQWLTVDYGTRILVLLIIFALPELREFVISKLRQRLPIGPLLLWSLGLTLAGWVGYVLVQSWFFGFFPYFSLYSFPSNDRWVLLVIDMVVGLSLVALSEELVGRLLSEWYLRSRTASLGNLILFSALIFGLWHWSNGGAIAVLSTAVSGAILMWGYLRCGSIWPSIIAHFFINQILISYPSVMALQGSA